MKTCATCKHWVGEHYSETFDLKACDAIPMFWDATEWKGDNYVTRGLVDKYADTKAFAQDGSDYKAYILTMPTFGCVMHEEAA